jgi:hypothetical protein
MTLIRTMAASFPTFAALTLFLSTIAVWSAIFCGA